MKDQAEIRKILEYKSIAVVGFSPKEERPSNYVSMYMQKNGYLITPVNPGHQHIGNLKCYPSLESIDHPIDIVNVFRRSEFVYDIVKSSIFINESNYKQKFQQYMDEPDNPKWEKIAMMGRKHALQEFNNEKASQSLVKLMKELLIKK